MLAKIGPRMKRITRFPVVAILLDDLGAEDVGRHQVGRELDAVELEVDGLGELLDQQRLRQAGHAAQQAVPAGEERDQDLADDALLADDGLRQLALEPPGDLGHALEPRPELATTMASTCAAASAAGIFGCFTPCNVARSFDTPSRGRDHDRSGCVATAERHPACAQTPNDSHADTVEVAVASDRSHQPGHLAIDKAPVREIVDMVVNEDRKVIAAVQKEKERIAHGVEIITQALRRAAASSSSAPAPAAGSASSKPPRCRRRSAPAPTLVQAIMAGGQEAVFRAKEGVEDNYEEGARSIAGCA